VAISATHYQILRELKQRGVLPQGGSILEIGQANWYGDCDPRVLLNDLSDKQRREDWETDLKRGDVDAFSIARLCYLALFDCDDVDAIDGDPNAPNALRLDLNQPVKLKGEYDTTINHGTAEHIFDIAQVFATIHQFTKPGGLMIHEAPFTGWVDHGFYCLQPTLFWDVAAANGYEIVGVWIEHLASRSYFAVKSREDLLEMRRCERLPDNAMLFVVMRKAAEESPFRAPMQGVYTGQVSESAERAWRELR
jgi:SAM-dependent methyltransferase